MSTNLKISVSGVRGIVGESLTPALLSYFAVSFGEYIGRGRILVGRDTRPTGTMVENAVVSGLLSAGCQPVILGIVPTPTVQICMSKLRANGGIVISASHNSEEWNALKFIGPSGIFLNHTEASELLDIYNQPESNYVPENEYREIQFHENAFQIHQEKIFSQIDVQSIRKKNFRVALDCCNGAGATCTQKFLEELGCEVHAIFTDISSGFERPPEPSAKNLTVLCQLVKEKKCTIGFAQDPDADRLSIIKSDGTAVGEQYSLVLAIEQILSRTKKTGNVVVNLSTTKAVEDIAKAHGSTIYYSKIGEINVTAEMMHRKAIAGGEGSSGGVIWPSVHYCRDSFTGMALALEMMASRNSGIDEIASSLPKYFTANRKIDCEGVRLSQKIIRELRNIFADRNPNCIDGIRIDWNDRWAIVRPSNTEPVVRITTEAKSQKGAESLADEFLGKVNKIMES